MCVCFFALIFSLISVCLFPIPSIRFILLLSSHRGKKGECVLCYIYDYCFLMSNDKPCRRVLQRSRTNDRRVPSSSRFVVALIRFDLFCHRVCPIVFSLSIYLYPPFHNTFICSIYSVVYGVFFLSSSICCLLSIFIRVYPYHHYRVETWNI